MVALKPVQGVAKVVVHGTQVGVPSVNVFHMGVTGNVQPWTQAQIDDLAATFATEYATRFMALITTQYSMSRVEAIDLTSETGVVASVTNSSAGTIVGNGLPPNCAQCISWAIPRHYRGGKPRTYLAPPSTAQITGGNSWSGAHATSVNNAATSFRTGLASADYAGRTAGLVCVHRYRGTDPETGKPIQLDPPMWDMITGNSFDTRIDSQRRRLGPDR